MCTVRWDYVQKYLIGLYIGTVYEQTGGEINQQIIHLLIYWALSFTSYFTLNFFESKLTWMSSFRECPTFIFIFITQGKILVCLTLTQIWPLFFIPMAKIWSKFWFRNYTSLFSPGNEVFDLRGVISVHPSKSWQDHQPVNLGPLPSHIAPTPSALSSFLYPLFL